MVSRKMLALFGLLLVPALAGGDAASAPKKIQKISDRAAFVRQLRATGHRTHGGIDKALTDRDDGRHRSFPHFTSSFHFQGVDYPFTMVGFPPASGRTANLRSVIIPLRVSFIGFDQELTFSPDIAVNNIVRSPMFRDAHFVNGVGQFGDMLQRATFWNKMDPQRRWHVRMDRPRVAKTVDVRIEPDIGDLLQLGDTPDTIIGDVRFGAMDAILHTILQFADLDPDEVPIFVTYNVFADALGYHDAFSDDGSNVLSTLIYTSWLEESIVGDLLADVSTLNHELAEWLNDPFVNNIVPLWAFPPSNTVCGDNELLEVGDPQGNGPEFFLFPTVPIPLGGFTYHLQDIVMLPWFTGEVPSSAQNGWYDFPDTTQITTPFVPCATP